MLKVGVCANKGCVCSILGVCVKGVCAQGVCVLKQVCVRVKTGVCAARGAVCDSSVRVLCSRGVHVLKG